MLQYLDRCVGSLFVFPGINQHNRSESETIFSMPERLEPRILLSVTQQGIGDLNGNGLDGLILKDSSLYTYQLIGQGITDPALQLFQDPDWQFQGVADFDGNQIDDVLMRHGPSGVWATFLMNSQGKVQSVIDSKMVADQVWKLVDLIDVNGDLRTDVLLRNLQTGQWIGYLMDSSATGQLTMPISVSGQWRHVASADFNGDGRIDVLLQDGATGQWASFLMDQHGMGTPIDPGLPVSLQDWQFVTTGDFNKDGRQDVLLKNDQYYFSFLMDQHGMAAGIHLLTSTDFKFEGTGDFNQDGVTDLLMRYHANNEWFMFLMDQSGASAQMTYPGLYNQDWTFQAAGRFLSPGNHDVLLRHGPTGQSLLFEIENGGVKDIINPMLPTSASWHIPEYQLPAPVLSSGLVDLLADTQTVEIDLSAHFAGKHLIYDVKVSRTELLAAAISGGKLTLTVKAGQSGKSRVEITARDHFGQSVSDHFVVTVSPTPEITSGGKLGDHIEVIANTSYVGGRPAVGDVDGDGDLDILLANAHTSGRAVLLRNTSGSFSPASPWGPDNVEAAALLDVDGDGDLDAFLGRGYTNTHSEVWLNDGTGSFNKHGNNLGNAGTHDVTYGDIDGDGDLDVIEANRSALDGNPIWLNDGKGNFTSGGSLGTSSTVEIELADLDGDGDLDAVSANRENQANVIFLNDGTGQFTAVQSLGHNWSLTVALADVDGDGDKDAVFGNWNNPETVWLNNGQAVFTPGASFNTAAGKTRGALLGDLDGDGDLDAYVMGFQDNATRVFYNDSSGQFTEVESFVANHDTWGGLLSDLDGDGDLDALVPSRSSLKDVHIYWNDGKNAPAYPAPKLIKLIPDLLADEDGSEIELNLNDFFEGTALTFSADSSNPATLMATVSGHKLLMRQQPDKHGMAVISVTATDGKGRSVSDDFKVTVRSKNDAPRPIQTPPSLNLDVETRNVDIALDPLFTDVDQDTLSYTIDSNSMSSVSALIVKGRLYLESLGLPVDETGTVVIRASDGIASATITIDVTRDDGQGPVVPEELQLSVVPDQVIQYGGQNTFVLTTNIEDASLIEVTSSNEGVIKSSDVSVVHVGAGRHRVFVHHETDDYGVVLLRFSVGGEVLSHTLNIVLPELVDNSSEGFKFSDSIDREDGKLKYSRTVDGRALANLIKAGGDARLAFNLLRPVSTASMLLADSLGGVDFSEVAIGGTESLNVARQNEALSESNNQSGVEVNVTLPAKFENRIPQIGYSTLQLNDDAGFEGALTNVETAEDKDEDFLLNRIGDEFDILRDWPYNSHKILNYLDLLNPSTAAPTALAITVKIGAGYLGDTGVISKEAADLAMTAADTARLFIGYKAFFKEVPELASKMAGNKNNIEVASKVLSDVMVNMGGRTASAADVAVRLWGGGNEAEITSLAEDALDSASEAFSELKEVVDDSGDPLFSDNILDEVERDLESGKFMLKVTKEVMAEQNSSPQFGGVYGPPAPSEWDEGKGDPDDAASEKLVEDVKAAEARGDLPSGFAKTVGDLISTGKKIYDIAKVSQSIMKHVGGLLGDSGSDVNPHAYVDRDGETYYMNEIQNRQGTDGRDVIQTGNLNDTVSAGKGNDKVVTLKGNDIVWLGEGRNSAFTDEGDDEIIDGDGGSHLSSGPGDDIIRPGGGNDSIESGTGHDWIVYDDQHIGNDLLIDPSHEGTIQFKQFRMDQIRLRKTGYDLEIVLPGEPGRTNNSVKFLRFFESDAAGWDLIDQSGSRYGLYELTGRIRVDDTLRIAYLKRSQVESPFLPVGLTKVAKLTDSSGRYRMTIAEDDRLSGQAAPGNGLVLFFEGDSSLGGWLNRNRIASFEEALDLLSKFNASYDFDSYSRVTVIGAGEGGLLAQWFAAIASTSSVDFVNANLVNAPDISGLISQVVQESFGNDSDGFVEYKRGFPKLSTSFLVHDSDWISKLGLWAGYDELYANWKSWTFADPAASTSLLPLLSEQKEAHRPELEIADFGLLRAAELGLEGIRQVVTAMYASDLSSLHANALIVIDGETYDATIDAFGLLLGDSEFDVADIFDESLDTQREQFAGYLSHDPQRADTENPFDLKLDFQPKVHLLDHLADGYRAVNEATLYNAQSTLSYGWETLDGGVEAGEDTGKATRLERDFVLVKKGVFIIDVPGPGTYNIAITMGDHREIRESFQININGYASDRISTMPGDYLTRTYQINTLDNQLRIGFADLGGPHAFSAVNGITVEHVNYRAYLPATESVEDDPSLIIMTQGYDVPETSVGIEILKEAIKSAAMAALTAGVGVVLGATASGLHIASKIGGTIATVANTAKDAYKNASLLSKVFIGTKIAAAAGLKAGATNALINSGMALLPTPIARGVMVGRTLFSVKGSLEGFRHPDLIEGTKNIDRLKQAHDGLKVIDGSLSVAGQVVAAAKSQPEEVNTAPWVYEVASALQQMSTQFRLGKLNAGFIPVDLDEVILALNDGKSGKKILKYWGGSQDFLVLDWIPDNENYFEVGLSQHRDLVNSGARALKQLIKAYVEQLKGQDSDRKLDLMLISHGAGYDINRELIRRLNQGDIASNLDYVKLVTLDPMSSNEKTFSWYHPEFTAIVDRVDNYYQTEDLSSSNLILGTDDGDSALYHGGSNMGGLDGRIGGGAAGFYNGQARLFDFATTDELLRFRHWDPNELKLSTAEMTDVEFSPDGKLVAAAGKDGTVTVRYLYDVPNLDPNIDEPIYTFGDVKFRVWGHDSQVRSLAFFKAEQDGEWRDYLLTVSAAKNPENTDTDKNKILVTDVATGKPVWQGKDVKGTQAEASPSGNVIVSADANGKVKIWHRQEDTMTYINPEHSNEAFAGGSFISDLHVINDRYFVVGGLNGRMKLFEIDGVNAKQLFAYTFDNPGDGKVRNLDYDPFSGILAVGSGIELSLWKFDQTDGTLSKLASASRPAETVFGLQDHVNEIHGVSFSKPAFLFDEDGAFIGDPNLPRTELGDIDLERLGDYLDGKGVSGKDRSVKLLTGGEDRTLILYSLEEIGIGKIIEETVMSGSMLPVREVALSPNGRIGAVVGWDNKEDNIGGPIKDIDVTDALDKRLGWRFSELFLQGRREHNNVPEEYIEQTIKEAGESFFWLRNSDNANRPGNIDPKNNRALPPNKRTGSDGVDFEEVTLDVRPGKSIDIKPLHYLIEADRDDYQVDHTATTVGEILDTDKNLIGTIERKRVNGNLRDNVFVFTASDSLRFNSSSYYEGTFQVTMTGPEDLEGNSQVIQNAEIKIRVINHAPIAYRDIVELHPNRSALDFRPRKNDYDFDNDDFSLFAFPSGVKELKYDDVTLVTVKKTKGNVHGVDIEVLAEKSQVEAAIVAYMQDNNLTKADYVPLTFEYMVREHVHEAVSTGVVEVRLGLRSGPENLHASELGADQFRLHWDPVSWNANKYIIQRFDFDKNEWVKHTDKDGQNSNSKLIRDLEANKDYKFRVAAKNTNNENIRYSGAFEITTPAYLPVKADEITQEVLGPAKIEVRWHKVFWNVAKYKVGLYEVLTDENGQFLLDGHGDYQLGKLVDEKERTPDQTLKAIFSELEPDRYYISVVIAKNAAINESHQSMAVFPVATVRRALPTVLVNRIGPEQVKITWTKLKTADRYRVVVIDPKNPMARDTFVFEATPGNEGERTETIKLKYPGNTSGDPIGNANREYVIFVEVKDRNGQWNSVYQDPESERVTREVLEAGVIDGDQSPIDLTFGGQANTEYLLRQNFSGVLQLPSRGDLFVGREYFSLFNLSQHAITLRATEGELVDGQSELLWAPVTGGNAVDPVLFRFYATEHGWQIDKANNDSEAIRVETPSFLAAEHDEIDSDDAVSRPKKLKVDWITPFWDVNKHEIYIYEASLKQGADPESEDDADYTWDKHLEKKTRLLDNLTGNARSATFQGLETNTPYVIKLVTRGQGIVRELLKVFHTGEQVAPDGLYPSEETNTSFKAHWSKPTWNVQRYRIRVATLDRDGNPIEEVITPIIVNNVDNLEKVVGGLEIGGYYGFTVDAEGKPEGVLEWVDSGVWREVQLLGDQIPAVAALKLNGSGLTTLDIDWSDVFNGWVLDPEGREVPFGAEKAQVFWVEVDQAGNAIGIVNESKKLSASDSIYQVTGLNDSRRYQVTVKFYIDSETAVDFVENIFETKKIEKAVVDIPGTEQGLFRFTVNWEHADYDAGLVEKYNLRISKDGGQTFLVAASGENTRGMGINGTDFNVRGFINANGQFIRLNPNTDYIIQLKAVYKSGLVSEPVTKAVRTLDYSEVDLKIESSGPDWLQISWGHNGLHVKEYRIKYAKNGEDFPPGASSDVVKPGSTLAYRLNGLVASTEYQVRVRVIYETVDGHQPGRDLDDTVTGTTAVLDSISGFAFTANYKRARFSWSSVPGARKLELKYGDQSIDVTGRIDAVIDFSSSGNYIVGLHAFGGNQSDVQKSELAVPVVGATIQNFGETAVRRKQVDLAWDSVAEWADWTRIRHRKVGASSWKNPDGKLGAGKTSHTVTGLTRDTLYEFELTAEGSQESDTKIVTYTTKGYVAPGAPSASNVTHNSMTLNWTHDDPVGPPNQFRILRNGNRIDEINGSKQTYVVSGLNPDTTYEFQIKAIYADGVMESVSRTYRTLPPPPTKPGNLKAKVLDNRTMELTWNDSQYEAYYEVYQNGHMIRRLSAGTTGFTATNLLPGTSYTYYIRAFGDSESIYTDSSHVSATTWAPPTNLNAVGLTGSTIRISWNDVSWNDNYRVYRLDGGNEIPIGGSYGPDKSSLDIDGLSPNTRYTFAVDAIKNGVKLRSVISGNTLGKPNVRVTERLKKKVTLAWDTVNWAHGYRIQKLVGNNWNPVTDSLLGANRTSYQITGLQPGRSYIFRVVAVHNNHGNAHSDPISVTTTT